MERPYQNKIRPSVLILGETGTGKEKIASSIHNLSLRKGKPFIKLNCAALPASLIESELFGHEKGAFTGAHEKRTGIFERADTGTLFLEQQKKKHTEESVIKTIAENERDYIITILKNAMAEYGARVLLPKYSICHHLH
ncbi:hypothetical protein BW716_29510 [[Flexibacter] sp. ATCC 35208]|nr:sigma 54-interacting transcriptional regulator [[Flexibacter] sp. ATCC 35208]OMP75586.1 hypothetical protein BW716_29510 [[Flexibacter] sp. ATCC 35208]